LIFGHPIGKKGDRWGTSLIPMVMSETATEETFKMVYPELEIGAEFKIVNATFSID